MTDFVSALSAQVAAIQPHLVVTEMSAQIALPLPNLIVSEMSAVVVLFAPSTHGPPAGANRRRQYALM